MVLHVFCENESKPIVTLHYVYIYIYKYISRDVEHGESANEQLLGWQTSQNVFASTVNQGDSATEVPNKVVICHVFYAQI